MSRASAGVQSAIDLGTNTILMVTGRIDSGGSIHILDDAHAIARLGQGVDAERRIGRDSLERVCGFLTEYRRRAESHGSRRIRAFGTSALRDAANRADFIDDVARRTGIELTELSGELEARYTFSGAAFGLDLPGRYAVLDIGGGSTELAAGSAASGVERSRSIDVGAVRVTERCFPSLPPAPADLAAAASFIGASLGDLGEWRGAPAVVGVAGTITTLGAMDLGAPRFDAPGLDGHFLPAGAVRCLSDRLLGMSYGRIRALPQVSEARADIIGAGSLILRLCLERLRSPGVTVSTRGIRYGLLMEMLSGRL